MKKKRPPEGSPKAQHNGNAISTQHKRIESALRSHPHGLTTIELVEQFDILRPGARISEMRWDMGINIKSVRVADTTAQGHSHRVVRYVLMPGRWKGARRTSNG